MGAPDPGMQAADQPTAESLLTALRTIRPAERARHERVLDYWLSIRGDKEFPPLHDLDPLEISDASPSSILLELIGGGQDAEIRHVGEALDSEAGVAKIIDAPGPSILSSIAKKLPIVAISRDFLAFEDSFTRAGASVRCWVTLLPLSSCGSWVDYVYAFVSFEAGGSKQPAPVSEPVAEAAADEPEELMLEEAVAEDETVAEEAAETEPEPADEPVATAADEPEQETNSADEPVETLKESVESDEIEEETSKPGFSKLLQGFADLAGFYGQGANVGPVIPVELSLEEPETDEPEPLELSDEPEPAKAEEPEPLELSNEQDEAATAHDPKPVEKAAAVPVERAAKPVPALEGALQNKLTEVRAKADEARQAQLRATVALHEGLSAAYDFALEAETSPEEYLKLVEAQGMKIQLRAPMAPVARLAFDGVCDADTIKEFETLLAWALKQELPRGELLKRIETAGGISELLNEIG